MYDHLSKMARGSSVFRFINLRGSAATALWTPTTSTRIFLTEIVASSVGPTGTVQFRLGNVGGSVIHEFNLAATGVIGPMVVPFFTGIESTVYDRALFVEAASGATDGWRLTATGFELQ